MGAGGVSGGSWQTPNEHVLGTRLTGQWGQEEAGLDDSRPTHLSGYIFLILLGGLSEICLYAGGVVCREHNLSPFRKYLPTTKGNFAQVGKWTGSPASPQLPQF